MREFRVAAAQMAIQHHNRDAGRSHAEALVAQAASEAADLVVLPELVLTGPIEQSKDLITAEDGDIEFWRGVATRHGIDIVTGSTIRATPDGIRNTSYVDRRGDILGSHDKTNLWKTERSRTTAGSAVTVVDAGFAQVGLGICWDITAPSHAAALAAAGADVITYPAYWCHQLRGDEVKHALDAEETHIEALTVTRAFENSVAVVFANGVGECVPCDPRFPKRLLGGSRIAVPFKGVVARAGADECVTTATISHDLLDDARNLYGLGRDAVNASTV